MEALTLRRSVSSWLDDRLGDLVVPKVIDSDQRVVDVIASTESVDRDGDIIRVRGWVLNEFKKNPLILFQHNRGGLPIAKALGVQKDLQAKVLRMRLQFAGLDQLHADAETIFSLIRDGFLNANSVGFLPVPGKARPIPAEPDADGGMLAGGIEFMKQVLLENSIVTIPANPEALVQRAAKELSGDTRGFLERELEWAMNAARVREIPLPKELAAGFDEKALEADEEADLGWGDFSEPSAIEVRELEVELETDLGKAVAAALKAPAPEGTEGKADGDEAQVSEAGAAEDHACTPCGYQGTKREVIEHSLTCDAWYQQMQEEAAKDLEEALEDVVPKSDAIEPDENQGDQAETFTVLDGSAISQIMARLEAIERSILQGEDELERAADELSEQKNVRPFADLPLASRARTWNANAAVKRVQLWAEAKEEPNPEFALAFVLVRGAGETFDAYSLPIADIVDGELRAVPAGLIAAAGAVDGKKGDLADVPDAELRRAQSHLTRYFAKMRSTFEDDSIVAPWESRSADEGGANVLLEVRDALKAQREENIETRELLAAAVESLKKDSNELFVDVIEAIHAKTSSSVVVTRETPSDPAGEVKEAEPPAKAFTVEDALADPQVKQAIVDSVRSELAKARGRVD